MKVAIVTPYYREDPEKLARCMDSVRDQTHPCRHLMVSDGYPSDFVDGDEVVQHVLLPVAHGDYGDTPRFIGTVTAFSQGFDAVCWLDADNWLEPDHVERMVEIAREHGVAIVTATRNLYRPDGTFLDTCTESDGATFNDTNCYFLTRPAMGLACTWGFKDKSVAAVGDRIVFDAVKNCGLARAHCRAPTVNYETNVAAHYLQRGETPPETARVIFRDQNGVWGSKLYSEFVR